MKREKDLDERISAALLKAVFAYPRISDFSIELTSISGPPIGDSKMLGSHVQRLLKEEDEFFTALRSTIEEERSKPRNTGDVYSPRNLPDLLRRTSNLQTLVKNIHLKEGVFFSQFK